MPQPAGPDPPDRGEPPPDDACGCADEPGSAGTEQAAGESVDWDTMPDAVRQRLATIAAGAVVAIPLSDVPVRVRPVARFAPAKRARLGGRVLLAGLRESVTFRAAVTQWARAHRPELLDLNAADPATAAAAAVLLDSPDAARRLAVVARISADAQLRAERDAALATVARLTEENQQLHDALRDARDAAQRAGAVGAAEAERLRRRLREQGVRLREARNRAEKAEEIWQAELAEAHRARDALRAELARERDRTRAALHRAEKAVADAETARQAAREARSADEVRLALLVDTVAGAIAGLRTELALSGDQPPDGPRPADLVRGGDALTRPSGQVEDPATLDRLLALPAVHLVVDGYNVTKTGYPDLTLSDQRARLTAQLAALAARTGAEITVVFDGAAVVAVPTTAVRGVRVLFSRPGVLADDVIKELVAAEPRGRPIVVITSDQEVAAAVREQGAYPVPSAVLLALFGRG